VTWGAGAAATKPPSSKPARIGGVCSPLPASDGFHACGLSSRSTSGRAHGTTYASAKSKSSPWFYPCRSQRRPTRFLVGGRRNQEAIGAWLATVRRPDRPRWTYASAHPRSCPCECPRDVSSPRDVIEPDQLTWWSPDLRSRWRAPGTPRRAVSSPRGHTSPVEHREPEPRHERLSRKRRVGEHQASPPEASRLSRREPPLERMSGWLPTN